MYSNYLSKLRELPYMSENELLCLDSNLDELKRLKSNLNTNYLLIGQVQSGKTKCHDWYNKYCN